LLAVLVAYLAFWPCALWATELSDRLGSGDFLLLMRHADAPGVGDPPGYQLNDCSTQRNLGDRGREQAARTGRWLREQGVSQAMVFSSAWCRCRETAEKLNLGAPVIEPSLASFFNRPERATRSNEDLTAFIAQAIRTKGGKALILVTHHVNIREYVGENIGSGDMVLVQTTATGRPLTVRLIPSP
jgi:phosphohistidine phosphatase SixA